MPSGITGDDIPQISGAMQPCDVMAALLESVKQLTTLVNSLYDDEGIPTLIHAREISAVAFPPGSLMHFHFPEGTALSEATRKIETIWMTEEEIDWYDDMDPTVKAKAKPFWVIANAVSTNRGAPNVSGRFLLAANYAESDAEENPSGVVGIASPAGDKEITLSLDQMPKHDHDIIVGQAEGTDADPHPGRFLYTPKKDRLQEGAGTADPSPKAFTELELGLMMGGSKPHSNMPPYFVVIVAYRTDRMI